MPNFISSLLNQELRTAVQSKLRKMAILITSCSESGHMLGWMWLRGSNLWFLKGRLFALKFKNDVIYDLLPSEITFLVLFKQSWL